MYHRQNYASGYTDITPTLPSTFAMLLAALFHVDIFLNPTSNNNKHSEALRGKFITTDTNMAGLSCLVFLSATLHGRKEKVSKN
jgi:hypothetical protein